MQRMLIALIALGAFAAFFPSTECGGLSPADCNRLTLINQGVID